MNKLFMIVIIGVSAITSGVVSAIAQTSAIDYLKEISRLSNTKVPADTEQAYRLSKEYLAKFPSDNSENAKKLRDFIKRYRLNQFFISCDGGRYDEGFTIGREILTDEPENIEVLFNLAYLGYKDLISNKSRKYTDISISYARTSLDLFERGVLVANYSPFKDKQDATAFMYFVIGNLSVSTDLKLAASNIYRATLYESSIKHSYQPFNQIASYYEDIYQTFTNDLKEKIRAKTPTAAELKIQEAKVDNLLDLMLDAYARAFARTTQQDPGKVQIEARLKLILKIRNKTDTDFEAFVAKINSTPMPDPAAFIP